MRKHRRIRTGPGRARAHELRVAPLVAALVVIAGFGAREAGATVPERLWGTYVGGEQNEAQSVVAVDESGYIYLAGETSSATQIATPGAYKPTKEPGLVSDSFLMKFDPAGKRVWGTYFGGPGSDVSVQAITARGGRVAFGGVARSAAAIATPDAFDTTLADVADGFVACFTTEGELLWGTYVGGDLGANGDEAAFGLAFNAGGDLYVTGSVTPNSGVASPDAHQVGFGGGNTDAYLLRLGDHGQRIWGTYYGGTDIDMGAGVALGPGGVVYVGGRSFSTAKIATPGAFQTLKSGGADGFVARFDESGVRAWGTYRGGPENDVGGVVAAMPDGGVVLASYGKSVGLGTPGVHQQLAGGGIDAIVTRFDAAGARLWTTYIGGAGDDLSATIALGPGGAIYHSGTTSSTTGIATPDAYQTVFVPASNSIAAVTRLDADGKRVWGTYYGGTQSITFTARLAPLPDGFMLAGLTAASTTMTTPGAHKETIELSDDFLARFRDGDVGLPCVKASECDDGHCVDGVCCSSACDGACAACSVAAGAPADGICGPRAPDECRPQSGACDQPESCDGQSTECPADAPAPDGAPCEGGACEAGACVPADPDTTTGTPEETTTGTTGTAGTTGTTAEVLETTSSDTGQSPTTPTTGAGVSVTGTGDGDSASGTGDGASASVTGDATGDPSSPTGGPQPATAGDSASTGTDDAPQADSGGCGCTSAAPSPLVALLGLCLRRRRVRPRTRRPGSAPPGS